MTKLVLPGSTRVGEMALFSLDGLPDHAPAAAEVDALVAQRRLMRFPMHADGGYLLHLFLDEAVPDALMQYCDSTTIKRGRLELASGLLGFGGLESAVQARKPDERTRSDGSVPGGHYDVTAYATSYPEHMVRDAIEATLDKRARQHLAAPVKLLVTGLIAAGIAGLVKAWFVAALIALGVAVTVRSFFKHPETVRLQTMKRAIELRYPSIIAVLRPADS